MKLKLIRTSMQEGFTTGVLYAGNEMMAHTLEPQQRDLSAEPKVWGRTAIPAGTYPIRQVSSQRFKRKMPYLIDVPHFTRVMFHYGNSVADTHGCILIGERKERDTLKNSRVTFNRLYALLAQAEEAGETTTVTIH